MVRQALFNILEHNYIHNWHTVEVLDLFAGTGALGIEALSRGALKAIFVETHQSAVGVLEKNLASLGLIEKSEIIKAKIDAFSKRLLKVLEKHSFDLVLADPPYSTGLSVKSLILIANTGCMKPGGVAVIEESKGLELPRKFEGKKLELRLSDNRVYGQTALWFYVPV